MPRSTVKPVERADVAVANGVKEWLSNNDTTNPLVVTDEERGVRCPACNGWEIEHWGDTPMRCNECLHILNKRVWRYWND